ncbi:splicing factor 3B subunit 10-domain-containing protein [Lactarius akahatsu]|uniref:Splicing factor 3B subunit 10-domain-containing protein n=1 Tax=Lactarius akahatsu TaxID=416441 RepID=A0AAD4LM96_9AGAM|nr:splicing factor 3B subunit 10-domain-containing protein [Lactarius akahatsu]
MNEQSKVVDFYRRELARALDEQSFGITHSEVTHFSENEAEATITLLEGQAVNVALSSAGYKVTAEETYYETLDDLLSFISPSYAAKRVEALMERLQGLVGSGDATKSSELRYTANTQLEHLHARYTGTGHADLSKYEWLTHQHRDTLASIVGHPSLTSYLAIADGEATGRIRFEMTERMLQPCGPPPAKEDD